MKKERAANMLLVEQLQLNIGSLTETIEHRGHEIFADRDLLSNHEITDASVEFLELIIGVLQQKGPLDVQAAPFQALTKFMTDVAQQIVVRGGDMVEFLRYIMFLQKIFLELLEERAEITFLESRGMVIILATLFNEIMLAVFHAYLHEKEQTIRAQQEEIKQTSTPITSIWDGVLTLPIIGTLDSQRTLVVMERLLTRIEADRIRAVVMDLTGVQTVDSQVAQHLIHMTRAIRLMGANAILTGIRPDIARALTSLNIELTDVTTRATLSDGLKEAFRQMNIEVRDRP